MGDPLTLELRDRVALLTLDRPRAGNSLDDGAIAAFERALDELDDQREVISLVLTAAGERTFSAGGDLAYFATLSESEAGRAMSIRMRRLLDRLWEGPRFVVAAINGKALGGGCELFAACHHRLSVPEATFAFVQARNGVTTGWGGGARLFAQLGRARALELLVTARTIDAAEAVRIGLVDRLVPRPALLDEALALAELAAANSPAAVRAFLELARVSASGDEERVRQRELELFADLWCSDDFRAVLDRYR